MDITGASLPRPGGHDMDHNPFDNDLMDEADGLDGADAGGGNNARGDSCHARA